jgi:hypothetical protein
MGFETLKTPSAEELKKQRDAYEEQAGKDARNVSTFIENIAGTGLKKEDVIREDAAMENDLRKKVVDYQGKHSRKFIKSERALREAQSSALIITKDFKEGLGGSRVVEGEIMGRKIKIKNSRNGFSGSVDGERISPEHAQEIYDKYCLSSSVDERTERIQKLHDELPQQKKIKELSAEMVSKKQIEKKQADKGKEERLLEERKKLKGIL